MNSKIKAILELFVILLIFVFISYLVQSNLYFFQNLIGKNILTGIIIYFFIVILAIVVAPIASTPLIPVISNLWGWQLAVVVSVISWTIGSVIVFILCRKYGVKIVRRLVSLKEIHKFEKKIPEENLFLSTVFLRMIIPVDILSYALGLFSKIKFWQYTIATFIGIIPFTILLSYLGTIPFIYQIIILLITLIIILSGLIIQQSIKRKNKIKK